MNDTSQPAEEAKQAREIRLRARYTVIEGELDAAPYSRVGTYWWDERVKEMRSIDQRLGR